LGKIILVADLELFGSTIRQPGTNPRLLQTDAGGNNLKQTSAELIQQP
jgi:hypothetical protein